MSSLTIVIHDSDQSAVDGATHDSVATVMLGREGEDHLLQLLQSDDIIGDGDGYGPIRLCRGEGQGAADGRDGLFHGPTAGADGSWRKKAAETISRSVVNMVHHSLAPL